MRVDLIQNEPVNILPNPNSINGYIRDIYSGRDRGLAVTQQNDVIWDAAPVSGVLLKHLVSYSIEGAGDVRACPPPGQVDGLQYLLPGDVVLEQELRLDVVVEADERDPRPSEVEVKAVDDSPQEGHHYREVLTVGRHVDDQRKVHLTGAA